MTGYLLYIIIAVLLIALIIVYFSLIKKNDLLRNKYVEQETLFNTEKQQWENSRQQQQQTIEYQSTQIKNSQQNIEEQNKKLADERLRIETLLQETTKNKAENENLQSLLKSQKEELSSLENRFREQFENVASKILKQNTLDFSSMQQKNMTELLSPLKEKMENFERKVTETYEKGLKDQTDMKAELKKLYDLNTQISTEANNLTKALKGDVKQQGNWGEVVLERILERSGLSKGIEYEKEVVTQNEAGQRIRPDVIIKLPEDKHLIIDSKVSLVAYEKAVTTTDDDERVTYIKEHINSIKRHIKGLAEKHYQTAKGLNTPDFVLLFIPVESSFALAVQEDTELFNMAWEQKIVIVSTSTLLATLRTIASIWKQEQQTRNVQEIARQGAAMYDKFVAFTEDLIKVGKKMDEAKAVYTDSMKKLSEGKDNLVRKAERLRTLGAQTKKQLSPNLLDRSIEENSLF